ncbi:MAG: HAMP domain-containing sensor histidine kinase [Candidatus Omnitrophota bacterium]
MKLFDYTTPPDVLTVVIYFFFVFFMIYALLKLRQLIFFREKAIRLSREVKELAHQAKLIVQNDMELKLYQEEIEYRFLRLTLLRNLISSSINTLDKANIFSKLDETFINNLGFKKALLLTLPQREVELNINFSHTEISAFKKILDKKEPLLDSASVISSELIKDDPQLQLILKELALESFLFAPIMVGTQIYAVFVLAKCILPSGISEAEGETFSIICMFLGQCLDNIKLFEAIYHAGEELESKIKEKTFELTKSLNEIKEISKLKTEFVSNVSHELRTPLTSIKGFSSLLVSEKFGKLPSEAKEKLQTIDANVDRLVTMVNTLLDISRIESKRMEINIIPSDLISLINEVKTFLLPQIAEKQITFDLEAPGTLSVYMDRNLIERVLINIISNAIKFSPHKGKITAACESQDNKAVVAIKDNGDGIEQKDMDNIFKEFYRTPDSINKGIKGTGLGLSLVKKIIEFHNEKIWVESQPHKSTVFYFSLKLTQ